MKTLDTPEAGERTQDEADGTETQFLPDRTQHTPGPWAYGKNSHRIYSETSGQDIATVHVQNFLLHQGNLATPEQSEANASLIAAAPELLEACKQIVALDVREGTSERLQRRSYETNGDGITEEGEWYLDAITNARAAIAKAEGRA